jgi:hypothetical protein
MKTVRFTAVVAQAGAPQVHALWLAPGKDPALKRAVRECRVMTIHQMLRGAKKDYGTVGLQTDSSTQVLVFPKSLRQFGEARIVGIDYGLIIRPDPKDPVTVESLKPPAAKPVPNKKPPYARKSGVEPALRAGSARAERGLRPPAPKAKPVAKPPPKPKPLSRDELLAEIRRAVRELKAGQAVAAYERLSALV